jgi:hypothetical protein
MIPEIPLIKTTDQKGLAKVAVFAYNRRTGQAVWQSGALQSASRSKDSWVFGAGPFYRGTVQRELDGPIDQLDVLGLMDKDKGAAASGRSSVTQAAHFTETPRIGQLQPVLMPALFSVPALGPPW